MFKLNNRSLVGTACLPVSNNVRPSKILDFRFMVLMKYNSNICECYLNRNSLAICNNTQPIVIDIELVTPAPHFSETKKKH